jgi:hypothetical protein
MRRDKDIIGYMYTDTEAVIVKKVLKDIELWHMSGVMMGNACDKGYCECPKIINHLKSKYGVE